MVTAFTCKAQEHLGDRSGFCLNSRCTCSESSAVTSPNAQATETCGRGSWHKKYFNCKHNRHHISAPLLGGRGIVIARPQSLALRKESSGLNIDEANLVEACQLMEREHHVYIGYCFADLCSSSCHGERQE
jgi:hypothetical protein